MKFKIILRQLKNALEATQETGRIKEVEVDYLYNLSSEMKEKMQLLNFDERIIELYEYSNGLITNWREGGEKGIGGQLRFFRIEITLQDWSDNLYYDTDLEENDLLEYYKPFDEVTPEVTSGFLITPEFTSDSIYMHKVNDNELYDLDIDFAGYLEMAKEAKIFNLWTFVLWEIQEGTQGPVLQAFKENMPQIFPDFNWDTFVQKYESLRLSKQQKED